MKTLNGAGEPEPRPERVEVKVTFDRSEETAEMGRQVVRTLLEYERLHGPGWRRG
jgi:hypothetical protein